MNVATQKPTATMEPEDAILAHLSDEDDAGLWRALLRDLEADFLGSGIDQVESHEVFLQIGSCSHWVRPHQRRLTVAGGFAHPSGYGDSVYGYGGLPEFDWSVLLHRVKGKSAWSESAKFHGKRKLVCRVAVPSRTRLHEQAVVHVLWSPGTPDNPREKLTRYFAYRRTEGIWQIAASGKL